ncbi:MAG: hypothetical protein ACJAZO_004962 [Myxococcota bacterium]|jgi:hypothetical protein
MVQLRVPEAQLRLDEHNAEAPPLLPEQLQRYGPLPLIPLGLPERHRAEVAGALDVLPPFAVPQLPVTAVTHEPVPCPAHDPWLQL